MGGREARDLRCDGRLVGAQNGAPLRDSERAEKGDAGEAVVAAPGRGRCLQEPAAQLPAAGGRHAIEVPVGSAAGSQDPENDEPLPPEAGERGVDLGDLRLPDGLDLGADRAREVVAGAWLIVQKPEENVRQRHRKTISTLI
jgi:hypothetical protein